MTYNLKIGDKVKFLKSNDFGTIVKRWLIVYNQKNYGKKIKNVPVSDLNNYSQLDTSDPSFIVSNNREGDIGFIVQEEEFSNRNLSENKDYKYEDRLSLFIDQYIKYCTDRIYVLFPLYIFVNNAESNFT